MTRTSLMALSIAIAAIAAPTAAFAGGSGGSGGYVDLSLGGEFGSQTLSNSSGTTGQDYRNGHLTGNAEFGTALDSQFALEFGAWVDGMIGVQTCTLNCTYTSQYSAHSLGVASHLAYRLDHGSIGALISLGMAGYDPTISTWANIAGEASADLGDTRVYGQIGYTKAIAGDSANYNEHAIYAQAVATYFADPNWALSGNLGVSQWHGDESSGDTVNKVTWGAQIETKLDGTPISLYAGYQGFYYVESSSSTTVNTLDNAIYVGGRAAFGDTSTSLKDRETIAGGLDLNPQYGVLPH